MTVSYDVLQRNALYIWLFDFPFGRNKRVKVLSKRQLNSSNSSNRDVNGQRSPWETNPSQCFIVLHRTSTGNL